MRPQLRCATLTSHPLVSPVKEESKDVIRTVPPSYAHDALNRSSCDGASFRLRNSLQVSDSLWYSPLRRFDIRD